MRVWAHVLGVLIGLLLPASIAAAQTPQPASAPAPDLFSDHTVLELTLEAPWRDFVKDAMRGGSPVPGRLIDGTGRAVDLTVHPRGQSRLTHEICSFIPLRATLPASFRGQSTLIISTHCNASARHEQYVLSEYMAYRILNIVSPDSLRVRLARITYVDTDKGKSRGRYYAFFVEPFDAAARRMKRPIAQGPAIKFGRVDPMTASRATLFQYMIGNTDWSLFQVTKGQMCCHNTLPLGDSDVRGGVFPVPYDFDRAGLVNADYAAEVVGRSKPNRRKYRGYCAYNPQVRTAAAEFRAKRGAVMALPAQIPGLSNYKRDATHRYLAKFYDILDNPKTFERNIIGRCRGN